MPACSEDGIEDTRYSGRVETSDGRKVTELRRVRDSLGNEEAGELDGSAIKGQPIVSQETA